MKKGIALLIVSLLCTIAVAEQTMDASILKALQEESSITSKATVDSVILNPNEGTPETTDYIALVNMTYTGDYGPKLDASMLLNTSGKVSSIIEEAYPDVSEMAIFWTLPKYDGDAKASFVLKNGKLVFEDMLWPVVLSSTLG